MITDITSLAQASVTSFGSSFLTNPRVIARIFRTSFTCSYSYSIHLIADQINGLVVDRQSTDTAHETGTSFHSSIDDEFARYTTDVKEFIDIESGVFTLGFTGVTIHTIDQ